MKCPFDEKANDFNRKLNGTYEDIDVYIKCAKGGQIFHYGHNKLQYYCPSLIRGHNIIKRIYKDFINTDNVETEIVKIRHTDEASVTKEAINIKDVEQFEKDMQSDKNIIFDVEETGSEVLFKFKWQDMDRLESILEPLSSGCNRSPFSTKNLHKSDYKIPDEDLVTYKQITSNVPQNQLITIGHITLNFLHYLYPNEKIYTEKNAERKKLGMKNKEYYHYIDEWNNYITYLKENI